MQNSLSEVSHRPSVTLLKNDNSPDSNSKWQTEACETQCIFKEESECTCCQTGFALFLLALTQSMCGFQRARAAHVGPGRSVFCPGITRRFWRGSDSLKCSHLASQPTAFLSIFIKGVKLAVITLLALILKSFFPLLHHSCSIWMHVSLIHWLKTTVSW